MIGQFLKAAGRVRLRAGSAPAVVTVAAAGCLLAAICGCHDDMYNQPRYEPLEPSTFFDDGMSARPLVPGTVARGHYQPDDVLHTGLDNGQPARELPMSVTQSLLERGQERFNIFCSPCHSVVGDGDGMIVHRGFRRPPSYHIDRLRAAPVGHFFITATNGIGAMPSYSNVISIEDRWAIAAYIRALQLSQNSSVDQLSPAQRQQLESEAGP